MRQNRALRASFDCYRAIDTDSLVVFVETNRFRPGDPSAMPTRYAAAIGKPIVTMINAAIEKAVQRVVQLRLFDTIGWATYTNTLVLYEALQQPIHAAWTNTHARRKDRSQPLFILDTIIKTDFRSQIFHAVENSHVQFRTDVTPVSHPAVTRVRA